MIGRQEVLFGATGTVVYADAHRRPDSITSVEVFENADGDDSTAETALGAASIESDPDTTFDAASGAGQADPKVLNVAATTGAVVGRDYLATNALGETDWVSVAGITSGVSIRSRFDPVNAYAASDTLQSTRMQATIDATFVADENNVSGLHALSPAPRYRIRWVYVYNSETFVLVTYLDLVRTAGEHTITPIDVENATPQGFLDRLPAEQLEVQGRDWIAAAYRRVRHDMKARGLASQLARDQESVNELVIQRVKVMLERSHGNLEALTFENDEYQSMIQMHLAGEAKIPFATDSGGAAVKVNSAPVFRR